MELNFETVPDKLSVTQSTMPTLKHCSNQQQSLICFECVFKNEQNMTTMCKLAQVKMETNV